MTTPNVPSLQGEADGFPRWRWDGNHFYGIRKLILDDSDVPSLLVQLCTPPTDQYPYAHGAVDALARRVEGAPISAQTNPTGQMTAGYDEVGVLIYYSTRGPWWYNGVLMEEWLTPSEERYPLNRDKLAWGSSTPSATNPKFRRYAYAFKSYFSLDYVIHYHRLQVPPAWLEARTGHVNANSVAAPRLGLTFAPETIKYLGADVHQTFSFAGVQSVDAVVRYRFRPVSWHKEWRIDGMSGGSRTGAFEYVYVIDGARYKNYPTTTFGIMP